MEGRLSARNIFTFKLGRDKKEIRESCAVEKEF